MTDPDSTPDAPEQPPASDPDAVIDDLTDQVTSLSVALETARDQHLRARADYDNLRKRTAKDIESATHEAVSSVLGDLLPVADDLRRAFEVAAPDDPVRKGVEMAADTFGRALAKHGVLPIAAEGETFDPNLHEALQTLATSAHAPGTIVQEYERGYTRHGVLLRPSRVVVACAETYDPRDADSPLSRESESQDDHE